MNDKEFLQWIHDRLEHMHKENPFYDYMWRLRAVIKNTAPVNSQPLMNNIPECVIFTKPEIPK